MGRPVAAKLSEAKPFSERAHLLVALVAAVVMLVVVWPTADLTLGGDHYLQLALRLTQGKLDVDHLSPLYRDYAVWNGHKYLPFGPLPAFLLVPVVALFGVGVPLVFVGYIISAFNIVVFWRLLSRLHVARETGAWLTLLYFGGTSYLSITLSGISTFFAHIVTTAFLLLALLEFHGRARYLLVGILLGMAAAARLTALFSLPYFLWVMGAQRRGPRENRTVDIGMLLLGVAVPVAFVALYNFARFGDPTESGFGLAVLYNSVLEEARGAGLFSLSHIPKNLYFMLLAGPQPVGGEWTAVLKWPFITPSPWGMGMFFTTPALLYVFRARWSDESVRAAVLAIVATAAPIVTYYGIGYVQFGYRYALDFMPFVMLLLASATRGGLNRSARALIAASVIINIWGAITLAIWI
jgi:hypothetical protein